MCLDGGSRCLLQSISDWVRPFLNDSPFMIAHGIHGAYWVYFLWQPLLSLY